MQDALGNTIHVRNPKRIVSLVPSQTEYLHALGLNSKVVGITKFCIHPQEWRREKTIVGGTKKLNLEVIRGLRPDLIIANKEENERQDILLLQSDFEVYISDVYDFSSALKMMEDIAAICERRNEFKNLSSQISDQRASLGVKRKSRGTAVYLIWNDPIMSVGGDTYISDMLAEAGFENLCKGFLRYPSLSSKDLIDLNPDFLFLSSEPFPFKEAHIRAFSSLLPRSRVMIVDGEMFSWYGARILKAYSYFKSLSD